MGDDPLHGDKCGRDVVRDPDSDRILNDSAYMKPFPPISPTAITDFEGCPKRWHETKILKKYPWVETEAITWGNQVHEALEKYAKFKTTLPEHLEYIAPVIDELRGNGFILYAELEIAIDKNWEPTDYWNKSGKCMLRGKIDLVAVNPESAIGYIIDWKTGKRKPDPFQLQVYAAVLKSVLSLRSIAAAYSWLKTKESDAWVVDDSNFTEIKTDINERIEKMRTAYEQQDLPARTSPLCCWCPCLDTCDEAIYYRENKERFRKGR
jgi:CRISPR/Cas system-associated exonuclease Cas4 (RecB family)